MPSALDERHHAGVCPFHAADPWGWAELYRWIENSRWRHSHGVKPKHPSLLIGFGISCRRCSLLLLLISGLSSAALSMQGQRARHVVGDGEAAHRRPHSIHILRFAESTRKHTQDQQIGALFRTLPRRPRATTQGKAPSSWS